MDSGNSGSISSSGDEEYDSRADTVAPLSLPPFLNAPTQFGSIPFPHSHYFSLLSHPQTPNPPIFDPSPNNYLQSQPSSIPNSSASQTPGCEPTSILLPQGVSSSSLGQYCIEPSLQLRSVQNHNDHRDVSAPTATTNAVRNPKKRSRASRRAPTTVLTTDTSNFRSMVQEFTGIPAPPFSSSSYSRRLNLLSSPSNPFRPSFHKLRPPNPSSLLSSSPNTMVDANAIASTTDNYHQLLPDLGLPNMLSMQHDHPTFPLTVPLPGFTSKSQSPLLQQGPGTNHTQLNPQFMSGESMPTGNGHAASDVVPDGTAVGGVASEGRRDQLRAFGASYAKVGAATCKFNFAGSSSSCSFDHDKALENNTSNRGEATLDSWICSSD